jgi:Transcriptional regulators
MEKPHRIDDRTGFLVGRAARVMAHSLNREFHNAGYQLTVDHWIILSKLLHEGGQKQQHLSAETGSDKTTITRLIDFMEEQRWLYRQPDEQDRRNKLIYLTADGQSLQHDLSLIVDQFNEKIENQLDDKELQICKKVLNDISVLSGVSAPLERSLPNRNIDKHCAAQMASILKVHNHEV